MSQQQHLDEKAVDRLPQAPLAPQAHVHQEEALQKLVHRLARAEGHVRAVKAMVQADRACPEVLLQLAAVRGAINQIARLVLSEHLTQCLHSAADNGELDTEMAALKTALDKFWR